MRLAVWPHLQMIVTQISATNPDTIFFSIVATAPAKSIHALFRSSFRSPKPYKVQGERLDTIDRNEKSQADRQSGHLTSFINLKKLKFHRPVWCQRHSDAPPHYLVKSQN